MSVRFAIDLSSVFWCCILVVNLVQWIRFISVFF